MSVLKGVRVLDFGRFIAGPFCGALLGDLGAEVIRVEKVDGSEDRFTAPVSEQGPGSGFLQLNRNKLGMTLNPRKPQGQEILRKLVATADVVIANLPPDTLKSMGLDYQSLCEIKPDIILTTTTAFGSKGPYANRVGFDGVAQAMSGNMHLTGNDDEPMKNYSPYVDFTTACLNTVGTVAAILHRSQTGEGQHVEGCLFASALTVMGGALIEQAAKDVNRVATGNRGQTAAPIDVFQTKDGWILVQVVGNPLYERWAKLMGESMWLDEPRFVDDLARGEHGELISERMQEWTAEYTTEEAIEILEHHRIPCGEVLAPQQTLDNEQVEAMNFLCSQSYPGLEQELPIPRMPIDFSTISNGIKRRAPCLGEHTESIMESLGYSRSEISELRSLRVV